MHDGSHCRCGMERVRAPRVLEGTAGVWKGASLYMISDEILHIITCRRCTHGDRGVRGLWCVGAMEADQSVLCPDANSHSSCESCTKALFTTSWEYKAAIEVC